MERGFAPLSNQNQQVAGVFSIQEFALR